jgi:hypothetical protein
MYMGQGIATAVLIILATWRVIGISHLAKRVTGGWAYFELPLATCSHPFTLAQNNARFFFVLLNLCGFIHDSKEIVHE